MRTFREHLNSQAVGGILRRYPTTLPDNIVEENPDESGYVLDQVEPGALHTRPVFEGSEEEEHTAVKIMWGRSGRPALLWPVAIWEAKEDGPQERGQALSKKEVGRGQPVVVCQTHPGPERQGGFHPKADVAAGMRVDHSRGSRTKQVAQVG